MTNLTNINTNTNTETNMTAAITFSLTPDQIIGALVHNESYVNSLLHNIYGTDLWQQVKLAVIEKYVEANEDNMRDLALEYMLEKDEDDIRAAAVQQLIDECDESVIDSAIQKLIDDGDVTDDAVQKYIEDNEDEVREAAVEKIIEEDCDALHRAAVKYYYEEHEESCIYEAAKLYQQQNFADVENAAVESLVQSMFHGDPYGLTIKVAKAWAEHRKQDAADVDKMVARQQLEAQIEDIKKKQQELELAIAKLGI
jgi:hypothetical protein